MRKSSTFLLFLLICLMTISEVSTQFPSKEDEGVQDVSLAQDELIFCPWSRLKTGYCDAKR